MWRRATALAAVGVLGWLAMTGPALAAVSAPDTSAEAGFASHLRAERTGRGLAGLVQTADLVAVARRHASDMASQRRLFDDPALGREVQSWQAVAENSGTGAGVDQVHAAFMASPPHRAIILNPSFTQVGIGVVWTGAQLWVAEVFRQPAGAPSGGPASPGPATPPAPPAPPHAAPPAPPPAAPVPRSATPRPAPPVHTAALPLPATPAAAVATVAPATKVSKIVTIEPSTQPAPEAHVLALSTLRTPRHVARDLVPLAASVAMVLLAVDGGLLARGSRRLAVNGRR